MNKEQCPEEWTIYLEPAKEGGVLGRFRVGGNTWAMEASKSPGNIKLPTHLNPRQRVLDTLNQSARAITELGADYVRMFDGVFPEGISKLPEDFWNKMGNATEAHKDFTMPINE